VPVSVDGGRCASVPAMRMTKALGVLLLTSVAVAGIGCGGGDSAASSGDRAAVAAAVERYWAAGADACRLSTPHLVRRIWKRPARCANARKTAIAALGDKASSRSSVGEITVSGDVATVALRGTSFALTMKVGGGVVVRLPTHRFDGRIQLRRLDGAWRVDEFGNDYMRDVVSVMITGTMVAVAAPRNAVAEPGAIRRIAACAARRLEKLPDAAEQRLLYQVLGGDPADAAAYRRAGGFVNACLVNTSS
jgi:hypothetical protein